MFVLKDLPPQIAPELSELLASTEPAVIGHFRHTGFMAPSMRALFQDRRVAGTAVTVRAPGMDGSIVHYAIGKARRGDILVVDRCGDETMATFGGAMAYAAKTSGIAGIIVDGLVTDLGELRQYGVPVWFKGTSAVTVKRLILGGEFCVPVTCGCVAVNPGDAILADENGVLVISPSEIEACARRALEMMRDEKRTLERLDRGEKYPDIVGTSALIRDALASAACLNTSNHELKE